LPRLTINGQVVEVPEGTNLIEAAKAIGVEVPHYCYHPSLSIAGQCRLCPVCDQAGECFLQIYYMKHGLYDPRMTDEKVHKPKAVPLGPHVILDAERCILCSRCVRFCDEITHTGE